MMAAAVFITGCQSGVVVSATRISPGRKVSRSLADEITRATPLAIFSPTARPVTRTAPDPLSA